MIIVTGRVTARPETIGEVLSVSLEHVRRSRTESGCLLHSVHRDVEEPLALVFLEHWRDREALRAHFRVPESRAFVKILARLVARSAPIEIFEAEPIDL